MADLLALLPRAPRPPSADCKARRQRGLAGVPPTRELHPLGRMWWSSNRFHNFLGLCSQLRWQESAAVFQSIQMQTPS